MIRIYLCEDENPLLDNLKSIIQNYLVMKHVDACIVSMQNDPELTLTDAAGKESDNISLFFIDVELKGYSMDGIELAGKLKERNPECFIVFLTSWTEMAYKVFEYKLDALDYIIKKPEYFLSDNLNKELESRFERIFEKIAVLSEKKEDVLVIESGSQVLKIRKAEIIFLQTIKSSHQVELYLPDKKISVRQSLKSILEQLDERFVSISRTCIVNSNKMCGIDKKRRLLRTEENYELEISHRELKNICNIFQSNHKIDNLTERGEKR